MASKQSAMHIVREVLDGLVTPMVVSQALFEALEGPGPDPLTDASCLPEFIGGPLRTALRKRLASSTVDEAIKLIHERLGTLQDTNKPNVSSDPASAHSSRSQRNLDATRQLSRHTGPLRTLVLATEERLGAHLRATFGPDCIGVATTATADEVARILAHLKPAVVIIDASRVPSHSADALVSALSSAPDTPRLLWGRPTLTTQQLLAAMERARLSVVTLDPREGVDPLIDMLRARMT